MANIATVAVAAVVKPDVPRGRVTVRGLIRAMTHYSGSTYHVPVWGFDDYPRRCLYTQHGEKWSPTGVDLAWRRYGEFLDSMWVRWYDDGGDHDELFRFEGDYGPNAWCRYAFDSVRVLAATGMEPGALGPGWHEVRPGVWESAVGGTYLAGNDRCNLLLGDPVLPGRTTPVCGRMCARGGLHWSATELSPAVAELAPALTPLAEGVELLWRRRPVQIYRRRGERWWSWNLDDWDNCFDTGWLAARPADV